MFKSICVFCGSNFGVTEIYKQQVIKLGKMLTEKQIGLVYGGGNVGLMGELARSVLEEQGKVIGIIPKKIYENVEHVELTDLVVVDTMHERKAKMYDAADGFIALPGGIGTIEELTEALTWQQLGYHHKPIGVLNINGFFDQLISFFQHQVDQGFIKQEFLEGLIVSDDPKEILSLMEKFTPSKENKWM
ncbi:TIGR00730 family Rossman fold protein [Evansella sp. AB-rgal1]|uniref:LOG family protein n=1 Tax=Evansella sp. AB-rgal1 TaxID=3242696 RepID=UPI00359E341B